MIKLLFIFLIMVGFNYSSAQISFEMNPFEKAEPFRYLPIRGEFWLKVEELKKAGKHQEILSLASSEDFEKLKVNEKAEVYLALAEALEAQQKHYLAYVLIHEISKIFPLSNQAIRSYYLLEEITKKTSLFDELILGETILEQEIDLKNNRIPADQKGFMAYLYLQSHRAQGFTKWEKQVQSYILPETEWAYRLEYDRALYELFNDRFQESLKIFEQLMNQEKASSYLRLKAKRQVARLIFEKGEFQQSFDLLKSLQFEQDDRGFILLERAWNKFYLKHYSKALGLLTVLDTPLFSATRTPEVDILKMLIYKDLCYYGAIFNVKKSFDKKYKKTLANIKSRKNLNNDKELIQLALIKPSLKAYSLFIDGLRKDYRWYNENISGGSVGKNLKTIVESKDKQLQDIVSLKINQQLRKTADDLLDWNEQINFLDYQSRVDSLKIKRSEEDLAYKPETISLITFDNLYWLYKGELWIDELESFRVLVKSQCIKNN